MESNVGATNHSGISSVHPSIISIVHPSSACPSIPIEIKGQNQETQSGGTPRRRGRKPMSVSSTVPDVLGGQVSNLTPQSQTQFVDSSQNKIYLVGANQDHKDQKLQHVNTETLACQDQKSGEHSNDIVQRCQPTISALDDVAAKSIGSSSGKIQTSDIHAAAGVQLGVSGKDSSSKATVIANSAHSGMVAVTGPSCNTEVAQNQDLEVKSSTTSHAIESLPGSTAVEGVDKVVVQVPVETTSQPISSCPPVNLASQSTSPEAMQVRKPGRTTLSGEGPRRRGRKPGVASKAVDCSAGHDPKLNMQAQHQLRDVSGSVTMSLRTKQESDPKVLTNAIQEANLGGPAVSQNLKRKEISGATTFGRLQTADVARVMKEIFSETCSLKSKTGDPSRFVPPKIPAEMFKSHSAEDRPHPSTLTLDGGTPGVEIDDGPPGFSTKMKKDYLLKAPSRSSALVQSTDNNTISPGQEGAGCQTRGSKLVSSSDVLIPEGTTGVVDTASKNNIGPPPQESSDSGALHVEHAHAYSGFVESVDSGDHARDCRRESKQASTNSGDLGFLQSRVETQSPSGASQGSRTVGIGSLEGPGVGVTSNAPGDHSSMAVSTYAAQNLHVSSASGMSDPCVGKAKAVEFTGDDVPKAPEVLDSTVIVGTDVRPSVASSDLDDSECPRSSNDNNVVSASEPLPLVTSSIEVVAKDCDSMQLPLDDKTSYLEGQTSDAIVAFTDSAYSNEENNRCETHTGAQSTEGEDFDVCAAGTGLVKSSASSSDGITVKSLDSEIKEGKVCTGEAKLAEGCRTFLSDDINSNSGKLKPVPEDDGTQDRSLENKKDFNRVSCLKDFLASDEQGSEDFNSEIGVQKVVSKVNESSSQDDHLDHLDGLPSLSLEGGGNGINGLCKGGSVGGSSTLEQASEAVGNDQVDCSQAAGHTPECTLENKDLPSMMMPEEDCSKGLEQGSCGSPVPKQEVRGLEAKITGEIEVSHGDSRVVDEVLSLASSSLAPDQSRASVENTLGPQSIMECLGGSAAVENDKASSELASNVVPDCVPQDVDLPLCSVAVEEREGSSHNSVEMMGSEVSGSVKNSQSDITQVSKFKPQTLSDDVVLSSSILESEDGKLEGSFGKDLPSSSGAHENSASPVPEVELANAGCDLENTLANAVQPAFSSEEPMDKIQSKSFETSEVDAINEGEEAGKLLTPLSAGEQKIEDSVEKSRHNMSSAEEGQVFVPPVGEVVPEVTHVGGDEDNYATGAETEDATGNMDSTLQEEKHEGSSRITSMEQSGWQDSGDDAGLRSYSTVTEEKINALFEDKVESDEDGGAGKDG